MMIGQNIKLSHPTLANGRWAKMSFAEQMGNLGSEISRALKSKARGNDERMRNAAARAIELFELSIDCNQNDSAKLKELCRGKEIFCDYIYNNNSFHSDPAKIQRYYDAFVPLIPRAKYK